MVNSFKRLEMIKKYWALILLGGILMLTFLAYSNVLNGEFQFDDILTVEGNSNIKYIENIFRKNMWLSYLSGGRPVTDITFALNYHYSRLDVYGYHAVNVIIHLAVVVFIFLLVRKTLMLSGCGRHESEVIGLIVSAVFGFHPINTQAVSYISQRAESLSALFYLLSLLVFIRLMETDTGKKARLTPSLTLPPRWGGRGGGDDSEARNTPMSPPLVRAELKGGRLHATRYTLYAVSIIFFLLALGSKFTAISLPAMLLLYQIYFLKDRPFYKKLAYVLPFVIVASLSGALFISSLGASQDVGFSIKEVTPAQYFFTQLRVIITYMRLIIVPVNQTLDYDYPIYSSFFDLPVVLSFLFLLSLFGFAVYLFYRSRHIAFDSLSHTDNPPSPPFKKGGIGGFVSFGILWFFITLAPTSSFMPVRDVIFEHRVYLPAIGMILSLVVTGKMFMNMIHIKYRMIVPVILIIAVLYSLTIATYKRNYVWSSKITLWQDVVSKSPNKAKAHAYLGGAYNEKGLYRNAIEEFRRALTCRDVEGFQKEKIFNGLGIAYLQLGHIDAAIEAFKEGLIINPSHVGISNNIAVALMKGGRIDEALYYAKMSMKISPVSGEVYDTIGEIYLKKGDNERALEYFKEALRINPDIPESYRNAALSLERLGRKDEAYSYWKQYVDIEKNEADRKEVVEHMQELIKR